MEKGGIGADRTEWNENGWRIEENGTNGAYLERKSSESRVTQLFGVYSSLQILDRSCVVNPLPTAQNSAFFMEKLLVFAGIITGSLRIITIIRRFLGWIEKRKQ